MADHKEIYEKHEFLYHYTSKKGLMGILDTQSLWATHYKYLNDTTEIEHMRPLLVELLTPDAKAMAVEISERNTENERYIREFGGVNAVAKREAKAVVDVCYSTVFPEQNGRASFAEPYITSFCSHDDNEYAQQNGLLSMWRAYGSKTGFAIVFDTKKLTKQLMKEGEYYHYLIGRFASVVYAGNDDNFRKEFGEFKHILKNTFRSLERSEEPNMEEFIPEFVTSVSRYKHRGFEEEREVRMISSPLTAELHNLSEKETKIDPNEKRKIKEIKHKKMRGRWVPYIELLDFPNKRSLPIKRIIIGPNRDQRSLEQEIKRMTVGLGIDVHCCETPYVP